MPLIHWSERSRPSQAAGFMVIPTTLRCSFKVHLIPSQAWLLIWVNCVEQLPCWPDKGTALQILAIARLFDDWNPEALPVATLTVNIVGCLAIGAIAASASVDRKSVV